MNRIDRCRAGAISPCPAIRRVVCRILGSAALAALLAVNATHAAEESKLSGDRIPTNKGALVVHPLEHATFVMSWDGKTIYVDPVGGAARFKGLPRPDMILITDVHGDHLNPPTLEAVHTSETLIIAPSAVVEKLPPALRKHATTLGNGETVSKLDIEIEAIPMYNLTPERRKYHAKGRGNGYVLVLGGKRVYISGDTEDIPEMRRLKNIDVAFVCMNLPYTMTVQQAADAVREFKPTIVYPYHYRGSDVEEFKRIVSQQEGIEVHLREWYP